MLSELQIILLALIQGLTEFLPISSSAHLILPSQLLCWPDQGLAFDVAVHVGSLMAVLWYFRADVGRMMLHWSLHVARRPHNTSERTLAWWIILATLPAVFFGFLFEEAVETHGRNILVIAISTTLFGIALLWSDIAVAETRKLGDLTWKHSLLIGLAQAIALIPGTSRSGITMTAAMALGYGKKDAARFSFLLSIPLIFAAGVLKVTSLAQQPDLVYWNQLISGTLLSFISAYLCITLFLKWIEKIGFLPFVLYRLALGGVLFFLYFSL